jgi:hypothetical protein
MASTTSFSKLPAGPIGLGRPGRLVSNHRLQRVGALSRVEVDDQPMSVLSGWRQGEDLRVGPGRERESKPGTLAASPLHPDRSQQGIRA